MCWERLKYSVSDSPFYSVPEETGFPEAVTFKRTDWDMSSSPQIQNFQLGYRS